MASRRPPVERLGPRAGCVPSWARKPVTSGELAATVSVRFRPEESTGQGSRMRWVPPVETHGDERGRHPPSCCQTARFPLQRVGRWQQRRMPPHLNTRVVGRHLALILAGPLQGSQKKGVPPHSVGAQGER